MSRRQEKPFSEEEEEEEEEEAEEEEEEEEAEEDEEGLGDRKASLKHKGRKDDAEGSEDGVADDKKAKKKDQADEDDGLPPRKPAVREIQLLLPGHGAEKITVSVRISPEPPLNPTKKSELHEEHADESEEDEEQMDEGVEEEEDSRIQRNQQFCPPWLPHLLSDDTLHWERTLRLMYGYTAPPQPLTTDDKKENMQQETSRTVSHDDLEEEEAKEEEEGEEEEEEEEEEEKGEKKPDVVKSNEMEKGAKEEAAAKEHRSVSIIVDTPSRGVPNSRSTSTVSAAFSRRETDGLDSTSTPHSKESGLRNPAPPMQLVLRFTDAHRVFFLVRSADGQRWYLLDTIPQQRHRRGNNVGGGSAKRSNATSKDEKEEEGEEEEEEEDDDDEEDEEEEKEMKEGLKMGFNQEEDEEEEEEDEDAVPSARNLDMDSVICIDALMLAALQSPTALRCCLSQREPVSLTCVEHWLRMDLFAAMPIFTAIHRMMLSVYATRDSRLPYELPGAAMDFNLFFTASYLNHRIPAYPKLQINSTSFDQRTTNDKEEVSFAGERRCIETMEAMLKVRTLPSRRILLRHLSSVVGIRLLLWLLLEIPKELLLAWGSNSSMGVDAILNSRFNPANKGGLDAPYNEEDEEEEKEEDEEEEDEERTKKTAPGVAAAIAAFLQRTPHEDGPRFVLSPFLLAVVVEIRRRMKREAKGNSPSEFTLVECVGHVLPQRVEDGRPRKDPLVSASFSLLPESTAGANEGVATQPRMQKLYQSDLVMLLLVMTSTPTRRSLPCSERGSRSGSVLVRPSTHLLIGLSDGHHELFEYLLRKKAEKVRTSKETMESGYFRLLYLCLLRFKNLSSLKILLSMTPLFAVLGPHDRSPFGDLVYAWTLDRDLIVRNHLELFLDTFWNELYYRTLEKQYDEATIAKGRALLLLDKMMERRKAYSSTLQQMWNSAHSPSRVALIKSHPRYLAVGGVDSFLQKTLEKPTWSSPRRAVSGNVNLSEYSDDCLQAEEHVRLTFESLALAPRSYLTPETLYIALFSGPQQNIILLRYLMIRCRVVTVCANPLKEVAVPAMEYALRVGNTGAIKSLLTIGVTLHDYIDDGNLAEDMFLCEAVSPKEVAPLLGIWKKKEEQRRINPLVSYGIIRTVQSAS